MIILGFDSSTEVLAAGLKTEDAFYQTEAEGRRHSQLIMDLADALLKWAGLKPADLSAVACMEGPGSFTGLRIGFSAAKALALALGIPLLPVPTLDCMARPCSFWPGLVLPLMDAKKNAWFTALYRGGIRISPYLDLEAPQIAALLTRAAGGPPPALRRRYGKRRGPPSASASVTALLCGPGAEAARPALSALLPRARLFTAPASGGKARELLELAVGMAASDAFDGERGIPAGPLYLRKSDAENTLFSKMKPLSMFNPQQ